MPFLLTCSLFVSFKKVGRRGGGEGGGWKQNAKGNLMGPSEPRVWGLGCAGGFRASTP